MQIIRLNRHYIAFIDDEDYEQISKYPWTVQLTRKPYCKPHACTCPKGWGSLTYMHRIITNAPPGTVVHHIDGNGLNNTRSNLRVMSPYSHRRIHQR